MVKKCSAGLMKKHCCFLLPKRVWQSGWKDLGDRTGKIYKKLPKKLILKCTSNKNYWIQKES